MPTQKMNSRFYIVSAEGNSPCIYMATPIRRMKTNGRSDFLLVGITPILDGERYDFVGKRFRRLIVAPRFENDTLFPVACWPCSVHLLLPITEVADGCEFDLHKTVHLDWAELYESRDDAVKTLPREMQHGEDKYCPVCGFDHLSSPVRNTKGQHSYEICPSCGYQFGIDDVEFGIDYGTWREAWVVGGMAWWDACIPKPKNWNPQEQLSRIAQYPV